MTPKERLNATTRCPECMGTEIRDEMELKEGTDEISWIILFPILSSILCIIGGIFIMSLGFLFGLGIIVIIGAIIALKYQISGSIICFFGGFLYLIMIIGFSWQISPSNLGLIFSPAII
ncbi:MAG: hypothetical protein ACW96S_09125, partial [Promethearchaeota archaeon]